jgi:hypothetical protein
VDILKNTSNWLTPPRGPAMEEINHQLTTRNKTAGHPGQKHLITTLNTLGYSPGVVAL